MLKKRISDYWTMTKPLQTGLLLLTGIAGFISARCPVLEAGRLAGLAGSLFLAIAGSTVLNMVIDRDIDARMERTARRPLPAGRVRVEEALLLGSLLLAAGLIWALLLSPLYALLVAAGAFFDVVIYTLLLKRRTPWSIFWGGVAGAMPIMAGRALGTGRVDFIGILLGLSILLWIPTHILTFNIHYHDDYARAGIPTFPSTYGVKKTRLIIAASSVAAAFSVGLGIFALGLSWGYIRLFAVLSVGLFLLVLISIKRPSPAINMGLFKYASLFMLSSMLILTFGVLLG